MMAAVSSTVAAKTPMPQTSDSSVTGSTTASTPSSRSPKLRRPCSQMICADDSSPNLGPRLRMTTLYCLAVGSSWPISSSLKVFIPCHPASGG